MDLQEIQDKLNDLFDSDERRIVFWYDDDAQYAGDIDQIQLSGDSKIIKLTGRNNFATKLLLEHQDKETSYLVYALCTSGGQGKFACRHLLLFAAFLFGQADSAYG